MSRGSPSGTTSAGHGRPGGVLCAYTYVGLQTPIWEPEAAWETVLARKRDLRGRLGLDRVDQ